MFALAAGLARAAVRLLCWSLRLHVVGTGHLDTLRREGRPVLFTVWHGRILLPIYLHRHQSIVAMVSRSKDGELAARVLEALGYRTVRGSSSAGGGEAYHALADLVREGADGAIIPDGPRGPARRFKPGTLYLARETGAVILPLSFSARPARAFASWDRFLLPLPFSRAVLIYGEPVEVPKGTDANTIEKIRLGLERSLSALEKEAEALIAA